MLQQRNKYININAKIKKIETLGKTVAEAWSRKKCLLKHRIGITQDRYDFRKYCHMNAETLEVIHFWTLDVSLRASYEITLLRLSVCLSVSPPVRH